MEQLDVETSFTCNGRAVAVSAPPDESLLLVLRERLGIFSVKDGCAPQGQCGCCTVLVDGEPRVACVTPVSRVSGRVVTTVEGLDPVARDRLAASFVATGGSQCGFCTPGIVMRARRADGRAILIGRWPRISAAAPVGSRCTTRSVRTRPRARVISRLPPAVRSWKVVSRRRCAPTFRSAAPTSPTTLRRATRRVAVPLPPGSLADSVGAAGMQWVVAASLAEARLAAGKVQGRRTTAEERPPLFDALPDTPVDGVRLATSWVEPAYLEPDASWCAPGGAPASPYMNGGAFGGKLRSVAPEAARELAIRLDATVRVVYSREDVVRLGPKRPPIAATARFHDGRVEIDGVFARGAAPAFDDVWPTPYSCVVVARWHEVDVAGPAVAPTLRAVGLAEQAVLVEGALDAGGVDRTSLTDDSTLLDTCVLAPLGASAGARVDTDAETGALGRVEVRVAAGDPLDETVLRSYAIGAAHMALGWVCSESLFVDPLTGEVHDLTIRSFGIIRPKDMPPVDVVIVDDDREALGGSSDAVFAAVAAAAWNALARAEGTRPDTFPARQTRAARRLRR